MGTESFYADSDSYRVLNDKYILDLNKGKKTNVVRSALSEYYKNHRPEAAQPQEIQNPRVHRVKI